MSLHATKVYHDERARHFAAAAVYHTIESSTRDHCAHVAVYLTKRAHAHRAAHRVLVLMQANEA